MDEDQITEDELDRDPLGRTVSLMALLAKVTRRQIKNLKLLTLPDRFEIYDESSMEDRIITIFNDGSVAIYLHSQSCEVEACWSADAYDKRAIIHTYLRTSYQFPLN